MESPQSPPQSPHARGTAQSLSINQLARLHCRERLLVPPLYWTSRHLELLQCSFAGPSPPPPVTQFNFTGERDGRRFIGEIVHCWKNIGRDDGIEDLVSHTDCPLKAGKDLVFFFDSRPRALLKCISLHDRHQAGHIQRPPPIAAYLNRERIQDLRRDALYPKIRRRRGELIAFALYSRKLKRITPPDDLFEPYIVAVLIAIAQEQHRAALDRQSGQREYQGHDTTFSARVLSSSKDKECMHLYSADITSSFLEKLNNLTVPPPNPSSISVQITTISFKPYKSLRDRIFALLLPPHHGGLLNRRGFREGTVEEKGENARHAAFVGATTDNDLAESTRAIDEGEETNRVFTERGSQETIAHL